MNKLPTVTHLDEVVSYKEGMLFFRIRPRSHFKSDRAWNMWNAKFAGKRAGRLMQSGHYRQVMVDGVRYLEHRLIAAIHGISTDQCIDHIDGNGLNNIPANLRAASQAENTRNNAGIRGKAERVGVSKKANGKFVAYIRSAGKHKHLGTFELETDALKARIDAEKSVYGDFCFETSRIAMAAQSGVEPVFKGWKQGAA